MSPGHPIILLKSNLFERRAKCQGGGRGNLSAPLQSFSSSSFSTSSGSRVHHNNEKPLLLERPPQKTLTLHALLRPCRSHASIFFSDGGRTQEIIACSILRAFVTGHRERRVKRLAGQDVIIAGHCPFSSRYFEPCIVSIIWPFQRLYKPLPYTVLIFCYERTCEILEVTDVRKVAPGLDRVRRLWREIGAKSED